MKRTNNHLIYSPTDLSNFINCKYLTELEKKKARKEIDEPEMRYNPSLEALKEKGIAFEEDHLAELKAKGLDVVEIDSENRTKAEQNTLDAMHRGADVIYQARLKTDRWAGWADFMIKTEKKSNLGDWSYEVWDTKLASNTKASTILQIGLYTQRIAEVQGCDSEFMGVIKPDGKEIFRYDDYAAYIRLVQQRLEQALLTDADTYPEPVSHCDICKWWKKCNAQRRADDHLTFVAGMGNRQIVELNHQSINTLTQLAELPNPVPFDPEKGSQHTYNKLRDQANIQLKSRNSDFKPLHQILPLEEGRGFYLLPKPTEHDIFLDFEGARMVEPDGLEYMIGYYYRDEYTALWAKNEKEELEIFEKFIDWAHDLKKARAELHIYHYAPYEPSAFKRLMGKYASRENEVDYLLRSGTFVDLYRVLKQSLIASVERYSLKDLEAFFGYEREMDLRKVSLPKTSFEYLLEIKKPEEAKQEDLQIIEEYNKDDCKALVKLQEWLEKLRHEEIEKGAKILRPEQVLGDASEKITEHQERMLPLYNELLKEVPVSMEERSKTEQAQFILAHFLDWYRREDKALWWEYFRLQELEPDELLDERKAVSYLTFTGNSYQEKRSRVDIYTFPPQEIDFKEGSLQNQLGEKAGNLHSIDKERGLLEIKKVPAVQGLEHPTELIQHIHIGPGEKEESIIRLAEWVVENGIDAEDQSNQTGRKLLLRKSPLLPKRNKNEKPVEFAKSALRGLNGDYLAIQGPPGSGKSYMGSHLIIDLVKSGKKVGITAMSHKVISNLITKTYELAQTEEMDISIIQKGGSDPNVVPWTVVAHNIQIVQGLADHQIIAGTSFMWARQDLHESVDFMFVDEAGQLALIDTIALAQASKNLVLLGDPNQLQQPQQGVHPAGTQVSALEHILNGNQTIRQDQGIFLETTWRMHPNVNKIVSELFYQNRLKTENHLGNQAIVDDLPYRAGLVLLETGHEGNTSSSTEEVEVVSNLINELTKGDLKYLDEKGDEHVIVQGDIKVISPYNAQVNLLQESIPGVEIGTVDKFQGQEAPIVVYSVASSSPNDAPRGMDFLYSPNRLNVAISRAKVLFIMVASPEIFKAECKSPKEMKLANAFCRFREMAES